MREFIAISIGLLLIYFIFTTKTVADGNFQNISTLITTPTTTNSSSELHTKTNNANKNLINQLTEANNMGGFLSDVLTFQTAILAFLIPLSFDVISRISDRYKSEIIIKKFQTKWEFLSLIVVLIINIIYILLLRFFNDNSLIFTTISLILALVSIFLLSKFLLLVRNYTRISYITNELLNDATQILE